MTSDAASKFRPAQQRMNSTFVQLNFDSGSTLTRLAFELPDLFRRNRIWVDPINFPIFAECFAFFPGRAEGLGSLQVGLGLVFQSIAQGQRRSEITPQWFLIITRRLRVALQKIQ